MMNVTQFVKTVKEMRDAQKTYFTKGRKYSDLIHAKELERRVDTALQEGIVFDLDIEVAGDAPAQGQLFETEDDNG